MDEQVAVLAVAEKGSFDAAGKYLGIGVVRGEKNPRRATSRRSPRRPNGIAPEMLFKRSCPTFRGAQQVSETGGSVEPGLTALTRILRSFRSVALVRANERNAALVATVRARFGPLTPTCEVASSSGCVGLSGKRSSARFLHLSVSKQRRHGWVPPSRSKPDRSREARPNRRDTRSRENAPKGLRSKN